MGKLFKSLVKVGVAAAAVGGICYAFKDKIKESKVYQEYDLDDKIQKVKSTIKDKMPKSDNEKDYVDDDEIFFDDLDAGSAERDYVSIDTDSKDEDAEERSAEDSSSEDEDTEDTEDTDSVPTINI